MSSRDRAVPPGDALAAALPVPAALALTRRRYIDMMRVCSTSCRPGAAR